MERTDWELFIEAEQTIASYNQLLLSNRQRFIDEDKFRRALSDLENLFKKYRVANYISEKEGK